MKACFLLYPPLAAKNALHSHTHTRVSTQLHSLLNTGAHHRHRAHFLCRFSARASLGTHADCRKRGRRKDHDHPGTNCVQLLLLSCFKMADLQRTCCCCLVSRLCFALFGSACCIIMVRLIQLLLQSTNSRTYHLPIFLLIHNRRACWKTCPAIVLP